MASKIKSTEYLKLEADAIKQYVSEIYSKRFPEPQKPTKKELSFWRIAGIEATLYTLAGIGITFYSAVRTGGLFFIMETLLLQKFGLPPAIQSAFSLTAMISSLMAFELFVLVDGFSKGKNNPGLKTSKVGLFSSLGTIILAGVFTGLGLVPSFGQLFEMIFYTVIAVLTAVAGGLVALSSGENIGHTFFRVEEERKQIIKEYKEKHSKWNEDAVESYYSSHYALGSQKSIDFMNILGEDEQEKSKVVEKEYIDLLMSSLDNFYNKHGRVPDVSELKELGVTEEFAKTAIERYSLINNKS